MIFGYLMPTEIANMRLISSNIAGIGLKYIATTVTLTLHEDSFDRLLDIAHHPVVNKSVRNLCYEHGSFLALPRTEWEESIITPKLMATENGPVWKPYPGNEDSKRVWRAFNRDRNAIKAYYSYSRKRLDQAFLAYQKHCAEESRARRSGFFSNKMIHAVQHFPNLETICTLSGSCHRYSAEIAKILKGADYYQRTIHVHNVAVTRAVFVAVDRVIRDSQIINDRATNVENGHALIARSQDPSTAGGNDQERNDQVKSGLVDGTSNQYCPVLTMPGRSQSILRIKHLVLEDFDWRLLLEGVQVFSTMKRSLSHLTKLEVHLLAGSDTGSSGVNDLLHQFVKLAPDLEELSVSLNRERWPLSAVGLPDIVGSFHWTSLKTVHFFKIVINADNLQDFCSRHSSTLSSFRLGGVFMVGYASLLGRNAWYPMFTNIRETTQLEKACIYGRLATIDYRYDMHDRTDGRRASGTLIGRYLVGEGGGSSLKDFVRDERRRIPRQDRSPSVNDDETEGSESSTGDSDDSSSEDDA